MMPTTDDLQAKTCVPCQGGIAPLDAETARVKLVDVPGWALIADDKQLRRSFTFKNFVAAQQFANQVGELSEAENHHPDITYGWGYCSVVFYSHKIGGLHQNDFIMAAKVNAIVDQT
ncbi:MAG: 4a-hydroxytetrahydrobiopterin dehydratase [Mariprofundus sp.]|nr:4a-hydroxytetrahydrobiopterin dehydratase [Mariprofundus sp.]